MNEPFFAGHFPGKPVMPGVLILESLAQAAALLAMMSLGPGEAGKLTFLMGIDARAVPPPGGAGRPAGAPRRGDEAEGSGLEGARDRDRGRAARRRGRVHGDAGRTRRTPRRSARWPSTPPPSIEPGAQVDPTCDIGPYAVVGPHVKLGARTVVAAHAVVTGRTTLGEANRVFPHAVLGRDPPGSQVPRRAHRARRRRPEHLPRVRHRQPRHGPGRRRHDHRRRLPLHGVQPRRPRLPASATAPSSPTRWRSPGTSSSRTTST